MAITFSSSELQHYYKQQDKCKFKNPTDEHAWATTQTKYCPKCHTDKKLSEFNGNTSGRDAFDKSGYRLRRPECGECTKSVSRGKTEANRKAKELGVPLIAPEGTVCGICKKPASSTNRLVFDHCHKTNTFRGYCCNSCNRSLGVLGDDIDGLLKTINYLLKSEKCTLIQNEKGELTKVN